MIYNARGMDVAQPVVAVIPGVQGRILSVVAETSAELNLRAIARLAGVSPAQASRILPVLVGLGIVERREAPPSALFRFVPEHVAARAVAALTRTRQTILDELGALAASLVPAPVSLVVFGSFARGEATAGSDIDVVVVRPTGVDEEAPEWRQGIDDLRQRGRRMAGNRVEILEIGEADVTRRLRSASPVWKDIRSEGVVVHGKSLNAWREGARSARAHDRTTVRWTDRG
jgi:DNA-binding transcriptional ArsR family regulator